MKTYVRGIKGSGLTRNKIIRAVEFYAERLGMSRRLRDNIMLYIKIDHKDFGYAGLCTWIDEHVRPREFQIQIRYQGIHETLSTLAHEMVHVKQYAKGEMRDLMSSKDLIVWKGTRQSITNDDDTYLSQPWEAEAFSLEKKLKNAFVYQEKKHGLW